MYYCRLLSYYKGVCVSKCSYRLIDGTHSLYINISVLHYVWTIFIAVDVPVEIIASFNKMKSLTEDRTLIIKAMKSSSLLEVHM